MPVNLETSAVATGLEKVSYHSSPKKGNAKECSKYHTAALISHASKLENSAVAMGLEKVSFYSSPKKGNAKECSKYRTVAVISCASKVKLKILQATLQQYVNQELPDA